MVIYFDMGKS